MNDPFMEFPDYGLFREQDDLIKFTDYSKI